VSGPELGRRYRREQLGDLIRARTRQGAELVEMILSTARGEPTEVPQSVRLADGSIAELEGADGSPLPTIVFPEPAQVDRERYWLADHVFGKAPERVEVAQTGEQTLDLTRLSPEALAAYLLAVKALPVETEAEVVDEPRPALAAASHTS